MKMYAIFPNPKSGLIEEQFIETENYTEIGRASCRERV